MTPEPARAAYTLATEREIRSRHFLVGGDFGPENQPHTHRYRIEVEVTGEDLDQHGFLLDLVALEGHLDSLMAEYAGKTLNALPAFAGLNPSLEHFSRILCRGMADRLGALAWKSLSVRIWEDEAGWAMYRMEA
jgi:6-pyruvoyltetrahydropterin/6-carboxytetrahydropterin synthase